MSKKQDDTKKEEPVEDKGDDSSSDVGAEMESLKQQIDTLQNQLKRAVADYQNLEKRVSEGRSELTAYVSSELIQRLLPVLDHLEKALAGVSEEDRKSGWIKGVEMAVAQFKNVLKDEGLEQIDSDGQFDPSLHEAIDTRDGENDKIIEVVDSGYKLRGKVIRPARVVVGTSLRHSERSEESKKE